MPVPEPDLDLERKLRPLAEPLPRPRPGDWLAEHDEPGQTFGEYLEPLIGLGLERVGVGVDDQVVV